MIHNYIITIIFIIGCIYNINKIIRKNTKIENKDIKKLTQEKDILYTIIYVYIILKSTKVLL